MPYIKITFDQARTINADEAADLAPVAFLSDAGRKKVKSFVDAFYDGVFYDEPAVLAEFEQGAECLLTGYSHVVELRRVGRGMFGGFKVDTLELTVDDFDWFIKTTCEEQ